MTVKTIASVLGEALKEPLVSTTLTVASSVSTSASVTDDLTGSGATEQPDPTTTGITALRNAGLDPLRLWSLKAPKDAGGTVSAVFLQAKAEIVFLHQLSSGRYVLFEKSTLAAVSGALVEDGE